LLNYGVPLGSLLWKSEKQKSVFLNACCAFVFYVFLCCSVCWFLYKTFCHGALKLDISTKFTTTFLWTSLQFILDLNFKLLNTCDCKFTKIQSGALWLPYMWADNNMCRCVRWIVGSCNDYKNMHCDQTFQDETKKKNLFEYLMQYQTRVAQFINFL